MRNSVVRADLFVVCLGLVIPLVPTAVAAVRLPAAFGDHMVLQADMPLPIWGQAEPDERVTVTVSDNTRTTTADEQGDWRVDMPALPATHEAIRFRVEATNRIELEDVVVGEVWICAGQSNMEWPLQQAAGATQAIADANRPQIRLLRLEGGARGGSDVYGEQHFARMTPQNFCQGNWERSTGESAAEFSAVGYFFGVVLEEQLNVPIGLISPAMGGTPAEAWVRREALAATPELAAMVEGNWLENEALDEWCRERARTNLSAAIASGGAPPGDDQGPYHSFKPGFMWQAGVEPLVPLAVRGVIWYQGESNAESLRRVAQHQKIFETLVSDWRGQWNRPELPFLFVQLPAMGRPAWPAFRQSQLNCLRSLDHTGMAVTIDLGEPTNVHPTNKRPVGERLAKMALGTVYQQELSAAWSGPIVRRAHFDGSNVVLEFDHVGQGLTSRDGQPLRYFEIGGADGKYLEASAEIRGSNIVLQSDEVARPRSVRYAWIPYPDPPVNFFNREGLPASPFEWEVEGE